VVEPEELLTAAVESQAGAVADPADPYLAGQVCQLILTAIIAGILRNVQSDAVALVRSRGRTYSHAAGASPAADPLLQQVVGEIASGAFAAEALVLAAADAQDAALATHAHGTVDFDAAHRASVLAAQAKVVVDELATRVATQLFDVGGSAAIKASADLDRHWRNVRTLASHNPTPYKARAVGAWLLNDERLPNSGFF
jgi:alkylation response protein AidB-like acyl-CoA dehydrogenase